MAECPCSNISIMQLFHELKQKYSAVPDRIVSECIKLVNFIYYTYRNKYSKTSLKNFTHVTYCSFFLYLRSNFLYERQCEIVIQNIIIVILKLVCLCFFKHKKKSFLGIYVFNHQIIFNKSLFICLSRLNLFYSMSN